MTAVVPENVVTRRSDHGTVGRGAFRSPERHVPATSRRGFGDLEDPLHDLRHRHRRHPRAPTPPGSTTPHDPPSDRPFATLLEMGKLDLAELRRAHEGG